MPERRICPPEFQEAIDERFGLNRFGGPRFKLAWSETETHTVQGPWGYTERLLCPNIPCWVILRWRAPECFGTPRLYELINRDPEPICALLGEYPYEGKWEIVQPLYSKEFSFDAGLQVDHFPLSWLIIEHILPILELADDMIGRRIGSGNRSERSSRKQGPGGRNHQSANGRISDALRASQLRARRMQNIGD